MHRDAVVTHVAIMAHMLVRMMPMMTPSVPMAAMGQCWAGEKQAQQDAGKNRTIPEFFQHERLLLSAKMSLKIPASNKIAPHTIESYHTKK
jgi:hypothetical protein